MIYLYLSLSVCMCTMSLYLLIDYKGSWVRAVSSGALTYSLIMTIRNVIKIEKERDNGHNRNTKQNRRA